jgi:DNA ligase (NAD+)
LGTTEIYKDSKQVEKPTVCPYCKAELVENGANLFCPNPLCRPRVIAKLSHFASKNALDIDGFSEKTAVLLIDNFGISKCSQLYQLDRDKIRALEGFKDAKTDNLFNAIENSKTVSFANFIYALGIENVGKKTAKDLAKKYKNLENLQSANREDLLIVEDVGEIVADSIFDFFNNQENITEIQALINAGIKIKEESDDANLGVFANEKVVLTGSLSEFTRDEATKIIESLGGEVLSSVSKKTTMVSAGESAGSKLEKAKALGIKIIDQEMFKSLIKT